MPEFFRLSDVSRAQSQAEIWVKRRENVIRGNQLEEAHIDASRF